MYNPTELLQFAVSIEQNGERFYRKAKEMTENEEVRKLFHWLALEEVKHDRVFSKVLERTETFESMEQFPEQYFEYLRAFVDNVVFTPERMDEIASAIRDSRTAIEFAMQREKDTILFYFELREHVVEADRYMVEQIIREERIHYSKLSRLLEQLED